MSGIQIIKHKLTRDADVIEFTTRARIYPMFAPQTVKGAYVIMNVVAGSDQKLLDGEGEYWMQRIQVEAIDQSGQTAYDLGTAIAGALRNTIKETFSGFKDIDIIFADTDMTDYDDARTMCRRVQHFRVRYRKA